uniref:Putative secreted protein n=1 Tax=Anopheles marajoara TaxID=58244 RepID=A0A2M4C6P9_9DIPT
MVDAAGVMVLADEFLALVAAAAAAAAADDDDDDDDDGDDGDDGYPGLYLAPSRLGGVVAASCAVDVAERTDATDDGGWWNPVASVALRALRASKVLLRATRSLKLVYLFASSQWHRHQYAHQHHSNYYREQPRHRT